MSSLNLSLYILKNSLTLMVNNNSYKNLLIFVLLIVLVGSMGLYFSSVYKYWPFNTKVTEIENVDTVDDFVQKLTNIYLENKIKWNKSEIELKCYSIILIIKSLTSDNSEELFNYLNELNVKDICGFKNFVTYLNSILFLGNEKNKIYKILNYFIDENENNQMNVDKENCLHDNIFPGIYSNEKDFNLNLKTDDSKSVDHDATTTNQFFDSYEEKILEMAVTNKENIILDNKNISEKFIERILELNIEENSEMLKKVSEKNNNNNSILENTFYKFLIREFYEPSIYYELSKLILNFKNRRGNPFLDDENKSNVSLEQNLIQGKRENIFTTKNQQNSKKHEIDNVVSTTNTTRGDGPKIIEIDNSNFEKPGNFERDNLLSTTTTTDVADQGILEKAASNFENTDNSNNLVFTEKKVEGSTSVEVHNNNNNNSNTEKSSYILSFVETFVDDLKYCFLWIALILYYIINLEYRNVIGVPTLFH